MSSDINFGRETLWHLILPNMRGVVGEEAALLLPMICLLLSLL